MDDYSSFYNLVLFCFQKMTFFEEVVDDLAEINSIVVLEILMRL